MFDVSPDEIARLDDTDLRELVGRLCEGELTSRGLSNVERNVISQAASTPPL
jgi:hypothetical protein